MTARNVFDATEARHGEPRQFGVGDFVHWKRTDLPTTYPLSLYSMEYVLQQKSGGSNEIRVAATEVTSPEDAYLFTIASATSASFVKGTYAWQLEVTETSSGNRAIIETGEIVVTPDLDIEQTDSRSHAEVMVQKIESVLEGKADSDVSNYAIGGRSLTKMGWEELTRARDYYRAEVAREKVRNTRSSKSTIKVRFNGIA